MVDVELYRSVGSDELWTCLFELPSHHGRSECVHCHLHLDGGMETRSDETLGFHNDLFLVRGSDGHYVPVHHDSARESFEYPRSVE